MTTRNLTGTEHRPIIFNEISHENSEAAAYSMTEAQKEIWLASQLNTTASCAYNETFIMTFEGILRQELLIEAIKLLLDRHDVFRLNINEEATLQLQKKPLQLNLMLHDLTALPEHEQQQHLETLYREASLTPFKLEQGPLVRFSLAATGATVHQLICTVHHLIVDGWSQQVLINELGSIYTALCQGDEYSLPEPVSYTGYAAKKEQEIKSNSVEGASAYWKQQFSPLPPVLELPHDRPRPSTKSFRGQSLTAHCGPELSGQVKQASRNANVTLHGFLLSAFYLLLGKLSGQDDLVTGIPAAGQPIAGQLGLVGHCVHLMPLRVNIQPGSTFKKLLQETKTTLLDAYDYPQLSFGTIITMLSIKRDSSRLPLLETLFNVSVNLRKSDFYGLETTITKAPKYATNFDLYLTIIDEQKQLILDCDYNSDIFEETTIQRWLSYYQHLLSQTAAHPDAEISTLSLITSEEKEQLITAWNATKSAYPGESTLHELFEKQVERTPHHTALIFEETSLTYHEVNIQVNQLAHRLRALGTGPGSLVGIHLERSLEMVIAVLATLKAGGTYLPLDPEFPTRRLHYMREHSGSRLLLTMEKMQSLFITEAAAEETEILFLDKEASLIRQESETNPDSSSSANDPAYLLYTSGSTGNPKGVEIPHCSLINFLYSMKNEPGIREQDILLAITTLSFDISGLELFLPLLSGASVVIASRETTLDPSLLMQTLATKGITIMQATPATWQMLLEAGWNNAPGLKALCGGEALSMQLANAIIATGADLWNLYGPTETTIWSTLLHIEQPCTANPGIGRPIANTQCYIVDANQQPVPIGVTGELLIGGDGLANGYWKQETLTREKFIPHPFTSEEKKYLYRTGDLARYLPDGTIEFQGRADFQVKIRGFRIETGEIEAALLRHAGIKKAAVMVREDVSAAKQLVAYLVTKNQEELSAEELRTYLQEIVPRYMVPSAFVVLERFPLTPNGKVDREQFPLPEQALVPGAGTYTAPTNPIEKQLAAIWQEVLALPRVGIHDNFFDLGGHSLLLAQVHRHLQSTLNQQISMMQLFQYPTIASLAARLTTGSETDASYQKIKDRTAMQKKALQRQKQINRTRGKRDE